MSMDDADCSGVYRGTVEAYSSALSIVTVGRSEVTPMDRLTAALLALADAVFGVKDSMPG